jgi:hypothetical protein
MIPTNAAQAISAIQDGVLGLITEAKIGDVVLQALTSLENPVFQSVTEKRVESGANISFMTVKTNRVINMGILLTNPQFSAEAGATALLTGDPASFVETWRDKRSTLNQYWDDNEIVTAQTHEGVYENCLVREIDPIWDVDENADAFFAIVVLEQLRLFDAQTGGGGGLIDSAKESVGGL